MKTAQCKRWLLAFCAFLLLVAGVPLGLTGTALAEGSIQLGVTVGIEGKYREMGMVPVVVTVRNGGADIEGDLYVATGERGDSRFEVANYQPVSIASGVTKQVTILVPGSELDSRSFVALMQNNKIIAQTPVTGVSYSEDTLMIGVLAENPDTANFLGVLPKGSIHNPVQLLTMKADNMPVTGTQLQMLNMLVINNFALDSLNEQQIKAIRDWTNSGGMMILAGGAQYKKAGGVLSDLSPVEVTGVSSVQTLSSLKADKTNLIALTSPFTVSNGTVKAGKVLYSEGNIPLMVVHNVGAGKVLYVAYDLAAEPVASWAGNSRFWADTLVKAFGSFINTSNRSMIDNVWPLHDAADRVPSLKIPEVGWFAVFFGIYALVVGPVLFYILRRGRKQSYMWVIVPALSVLAGIGIFSIGAIQRGVGVKLHQVGYVELQNNGQANAVSVTALFVPSNDDYRLTIKGEGITQPVTEGDYIDQIPRTWISIQPDQTHIDFRDVEFWSMRKVATEQSLSDVGKIESNLSYENGALKGTVTNHTKYSLRDVTISTGMQVQEFPQLAAGSSIEVNLPFAPQQQARRNQHRMNMGHALPQYMQSNGNERETREQLIVEMLDMMDRRSGPSEVVKLVGWTDAQVAEAVVPNENTENSSIAMVTSTLQVNPSKDGHIYYPTGSFDVTMSGSSVPVDDFGDGFRLPAGDITFDINLNQEGQELAISNLYLYTWSEDNTTFGKEVYNWKTKAFEPFEKAFMNNVMTSDKTTTYVSGDGIVRIKFAHQFEDDRHIGVPSVSVEGKVSKK
ncbi:hypothetical protein HP567_027745 [Brevibacillus sp. M2.1A]|uniref:DUF7408 domain-containing protein n=1 Tax=unclassified Brevibacillus TaxID=2684853 RepID=UPI001E614A3B|nr:MULTISPECIES: hypothetical protein [unclassified Brevibacillus]MCC8438337.1 hypothetical protein [Brevibacillus sp. M2.1A]